MKLFSARWEGRVCMEPSWPCAGAQCCVSETAHKDILLVWAPLWGEVGWWKCPDTLLRVGVWPHRLCSMFLLLKWNWELSNDSIREWVCRVALWSLLLVNILFGVKWRPGQIVFWPLSFLHICANYLISSIVKTLSKSVLKTLLKWK